jgi:hypothetical protein
MAPPDPHHGIFTKRYCGCRACGVPIIPSDTAGCMPHPAEFMHTSRSGSASARLGPCLPVVQPQCSSDTLSIYKRKRSWHVVCCVRHLAPSLCTAHLRLLEVVLKGRCYGSEKPNSLARVIHCTQMRQAEGESFGLRFINIYRLIYAMTYTTYLDWIHWPVLVQCATDHHLVLPRLCTYQVLVSPQVISIPCICQS